jgi:hypothetical protein
VWDALGGVAVIQEFTQEIKNIVSDMIRDVHTAVPGKILSFDPGSSTASVKPSAKLRKPDGTSMDFPPIHGVPVFFPQASAQSVTFAWHIEEGDEVVLFFLEQALDQWRTGAESKTELKFDLQNAIAFTGLFAKSNPLVQRAADNESIIVQRDGSFVEIYGTTGQIDVYATDDINAKTEKNLNVKAAADINVEAAANIKITADANLDIKSTGPMTLSSGASIRMAAPRIDFN